MIQILLEITQIGAVSSFMITLQLHRKKFPFRDWIYTYGTGLFTDDRFEFWTGKSLSIANHKRTPNLEIRTSGDTLAGFGQWFWMDWHSIGGISNPRRKW